MHYYPKYIITHNTALKHITHTPHPPNQCAQVSKSRGGRVLTLHIPPTKLMCSSLQVKRWMVLILHIPPHQTNVLKSPSQEVGGLILHIPPTKPMCSSLQVKRWEGIDITHTPHQTDVLKSVSKSRGGGRY